MSFAIPLPTSPAAPVTRLSIRLRLDGCLKRIRAREQSSLIAGLRATNEQALLRLNEERKLEREREEKEVRTGGLCWGRVESVTAAERTYCLTSSILHNEPISVYCLLSCSFVWRVLISRCL